MLKRKKRVNKIVVLITILIILLLCSTLYILASDDTDIASFLDIYGEKVSNYDYTEKANEYLTGSEADKKLHLGKSVGYPALRNESDYWSVKKFNQVWCFSEGQINSRYENRSKNRTFKGIWNYRNR